MWAWVDRVRAPMIWDQARGAHIHRDGGHRILWRDRHDRICQEVARDQADVVEGEGVGEVSRRHPPPGRADEVGEDDDRVVLLQRQLALLCGEVEGGGANKTPRSDVVGGRRLCRRRSGRGRRRGGRCRLVSVIKALLALLPRTLHGGRPF